MVEIETFHYTLSDVMTMTNLSERTMRRHIRNGLIKGAKIGGVWRFSEENLKAYFNKDMMIESFKDEESKIVKKFLKRDYQHSNDHRICMVVDQDVLSKDMEKSMKETIMELSNRHEDLRMKYTKKNQTMRFTLIGTYAFIEACLSALRTIKEEYTD
ncbi:MAG: helix-turn-helix domain-containing protein [Bacillota bacterium]